MKFTLDNINAYNEAENEFDRIWEPLETAIAQAVVDHPTQFTYLRSASDVSDIKVMVFGGKDDRRVRISFTDQYGDSEDLIIPAEALDHEGGVAGYVNERVAKLKAAEEQREAERAANQQQRNRADMLETIGRAMALHGFTPEELADATAKASAE